MIFDEDKMEEKLQKSIKDYEKVLEEFGKSLEELINLSYHHKVHEDNYEAFVKDLEKNIPEELTKKENLPLLQKIIESLAKIKKGENNGD